MSPATSQLFDMGDAKPNRKKGRNKKKKKKKKKNQNNISLLPKIDTPPKKSTSQKYETRKEKKKKKKKDKRTKHNIAVLGNAKFCYLSSISRHHNQTRSKLFHVCHKFHLKKKKAPHTSTK